MLPKLAIDGGTPVRTAPFHPWPVFDETEERNLLEVLHSGKWGSLAGSKVTEFEQKFAAFQSARFGVCVPNGTLALEMALRALGVGPGDEVITTPYTFIATANAILLTGATPIFVDIDLTTYNLDAVRVEEVLSERTKAIVPVHLGGRPADLDALLPLAQKHHLFLLEDACQAWGSEWRGQRVGALGSLGAFSFQAGKNITAGEGGIVLTNDPDLAEKCWSLHNVGRIRAGAWYQHEIVGLNLRLPEWEGAILLAQLERLPRHAKIRAENVRYLREVLPGAVDGLTLLGDDPRVTANSNHLFILRYDAQAFGGHSRAEFIDALMAEGITPISNGYIPLHHSPAMQRAVNTADLNRCALPFAEQAGNETLWINQSPFLGGHQDMDSIVGAMKKIQTVWHQAGKPMRAIDIHTHIGRLLVDLAFNQPEDLIEFLDLHQIDLAAVMAVENTGEVDFYVTTEQVLAACARFPERLMPFCNLDPRHRYPDTFNPRPIIAEYVQRGCRGFGEVLADVPIDYPGLQAIYAACGDFELPVLFHADHWLCYDEPGAPRLEKMLQTFPKTIFIGHAVRFWAEISGEITAADYRMAHYAQGPVKPGGSTDRLLSRYPNLYGDLSANSGYNALTRDPAFGLEFLNRHQDQLLMGTDCLKPGHAAPIVEFIRSAPISEEARQKILWKNAARLLKIEGK